jgi:uncharacterized protein YhaN
MTPTEAGMVAAHSIMTKARAMQYMLDGQFLSPIWQLLILKQKHLTDAIPNRLRDSHKLKNVISLRRVLSSQADSVTRQQQPPATPIPQPAPTTTTKLPEYSFVPSIHFCAIFIALLLFLVLLLLYTRSKRSPSSQNAEQWHSVSVSSTRARCLPKVYLQSPKSASNTSDTTPLTISIDDIDYSDLELEFELRETQEKLVWQDEQIQRYASRLAGRLEDDMDDPFPDLDAEFELRLSQESLQEQQTRISELERAVAAQSEKTAIEQSLTRQKQSELDNKNAQLKNVAKALKANEMAKETIIDLQSQLHELKHELADAQATHELDQEDLSTLMSRLEAREGQLKQEREARAELQDKMVRQMELEVEQLKRDEELHEAEVLAKTAMEETLTKTQEQLRDALDDKASARQCCEEALAMNERIVNDAERILKELKAAKSKKGGEPCDCELRNIQEHQSLITENKVTLDANLLPGRQSETSSTGVDKAQPPSSIPRRPSRLSLGEYKNSSVSQIASPSLSELDDFVAARLKPIIMRGGSRSGIPLKTPTTPSFEYDSSDLPPTPSYMEPTEASSAKKA